MSEKPGRKTQESIAVVERLEYVYQYMLIGLTARQIQVYLKSKGIAVTTRTVERDIQKLRAKNAEWYKQNRTIQKRMENIFKESLDAKREIFKEAWLTYVQADKAVMKTMALTVALNASKAADELLGFTGLTPMQIELQEKLEILDAEIKGLREFADAEKPAPQSR